MSEKANINVAIDNIKNIPQIKTDHKVTLDMSSFLFSIGDIKNRKKSPLKAKILLAPLRNILSNPLLNIGKERSILSISATNINIKLELGNEIFITRNIEELIDAKKASMLGESEYILIELPMFQRLTSAINLISDLPYSKIILAHPERYEYVQDNISYLDEFIDMGILLQGNYESILGKYGRKAEKTLKKLLKQHKVDLLSTDTHRKNSTYARFFEIEKKLKKLVKEDYYKDLTYNLPKDILRNI